MPADGTDADTQVQQDIEAARDAYTAGQHQVVINFPPGAAQPVPRRAWGDVPAGNLGFVGREDLLGAVREALAGGDRAVVQVLRGMGGVGKTQLAIEYAHRHAPAYDIVWWINAEQPELISGQFASLAAALGCNWPTADNAAGRRVVLAELRERDRWLLVFDNADNPEDIAGWLPGGTGHVLITSRAHGWDELAVPVEVDVLDRGESVGLLVRRVPGLREDEVGLVAQAVGDLPLALAQAAAYMGPASIPAADYVRLVEQRAAEILDAGRPKSYQLSLAAVTQLALDRLEAQDPAAAQAVRICSFLAPEPVPATWFTSAAGLLPEPLSTAAADPLAWGQALARISGQALARIDSQGLLSHRLTQAIIRTRLSPGETAAGREQAAKLLTASHPGDPGDQQLPSTWPGWARLLPHLLALDPDTSAPTLSALTHDAVWYLYRRGLARDAYELARRLHQNRLAQDGPDASSTFDAVDALTGVLYDSGRYAEARTLDEDTLARRRRVLGEDHTSTLGSALNLVGDLKMLGETQAARALGEDTLARRRRLHGEDHPQALASASNLAGLLAEQGEYEAARHLDEDTLARRRRVLGEDHPDTLTSASNLTEELYELGEYEAARELGEHTLARSRRALGEDHPYTLDCASTLAIVLSALGEAQTARELGEDALARCRRAEDEDHPRTLTSAHNFAVVLRRLGEGQAARELDEDTLARRCRVLGEDHPETLTSASNLAEDLYELGEYEAARHLDEDTLARRRRILGEDHPGTRRSARNLDADLRALGESRNG